MKTFLIADDSRFMLNILKNVLHTQGHKVIGEATNGRIAFEKYKELSPDIVTLDITMDEMTGLEALKAIVDFDRDAKVIMVSAMGQQNFVKEAISAGAKGFLVKPFSPESVASAIYKL